MLRIVPATLALASTALAGTASFDGRWDLDVHGGYQQAWWMEIHGAGTPKMTGRFTGFWGGGTNDIVNPRIDTGILRFNSDLGDIHAEYTARLILTGQEPILEGERKIGTDVVKFTGKRAPQIEEHDDGTWKAGTPVELLNGKDLTGWHALPPGPDPGWSVVDGVLKGTGTARNLVTDAKFWNFNLRVEYRIMPKSNSGIGLRGRYEVQIIDDAGHDPNLTSNGSLYSRIAPRVNASKPAGQWQTFDIRLVGLDLSVSLNNQKLIDKGHVDGLTAMGFDAHESRPGPIALQGDHGPVEFRRITITPLTR